jgi:hypothetical protein
MKKQVLIATAIVLCSFAIGAVEGVAQQIFNQFRQPKLVVGLPYRDIDACPVSSLNKTVIPPSQFTLPPTYVNDLDDGYAYIQFPNGETYNYNGRLYTGVYVSVNGFLTFDNTKLVPAKQSIGLFINSSSYPDNVVSPYWGDHRYRVAGDIAQGYMPSQISWVVDVDRDENCDTIKPVRRCVVVQWKNLNINAQNINSSVGNFQARLYLGGQANNNQGEVEFAYGQVGGNPYTNNTTVVTRGATVGIKGDGGFPGFLSDFWNGLIWQPNAGSNTRTDSTSVWQPSGGRSDARIRFESIIYLTFSDWGYGDADTSGAENERHGGLPQNRRVTVNDARVIMRSMVTRVPLDSVWKRQAYLGDVNHSGRYYFTKLKRDFSGDSLVGGNIVIWRRTIDVEQFFPGQGVGPTTGKQVVRVMYEGDGLYGVDGKAPDVSSLNQIYYECNEYDAGLIMRYISGRLPYLPWIYDNDTLGPDFGKVVEVAEASNIKFGTPTSVGSGLVRVPVYLNGAHKGAIGVRFTSDAEIVDIVKAGNTNVLVDATTDVVAIAGNGTFEAGQPVAYLTIKEAGIANITDVRFNDAAVTGHKLNMIETDNNVISIYPNPVAGAMSVAVNVVEAGSISARVFDSFGKLVAEIANENVAAGTFSASWDGNDSNGNAVAAGSYMVRIEGAGVNATQMFTVVR